MSKPVFVVLLAGLASVAVAQEKDKIVWTDGTSITDASVSAFSWREIKFTHKGRTEQRPTDAVVSVTLGKTKEAYKRALNADTKDESYQQFLSVAEKLVPTDPMLAQFGYWEASQLQVKNGSWAEAFAVLDKMVVDLPETAFYPHYFRLKAEYYLDQGKAKAGDAATVAKKYVQMAGEKAWPEGFLHEAAYYELMASLAAEQMNAQQAVAAFKGLLEKTDGPFPAVASRVRVQLANVQRQANQLADAKKAYESIVDNAASDPSTRAEAQLGLGHIGLLEGDPANTEPFRSALLAFLRVYFEAPESAPGLRAEALYQASVAADKWRGPDSAAMASRLRGILRRDFPESSWAKR